MCAAQIEIILLRTLGGEALIGAREMRSEISYSLGNEAEKAKPAKRAETARHLGAEIVARARRMSSLKAMCA